MHDLAQRDDGRRWLFDGRNDPITGCQKAKILQHWAAVLGQGIKGGLVDLGCSGSAIWEAETKFDISAAEPVRAPTAVDGLEQGPRAPALDLVTPIAHLEFKPEFRVGEIAKPVEAEGTKKSRDAEIDATGFRFA